MGSITILSVVFQKSQYINVYWSQSCPLEPITVTYIVFMIFWQARLALDSLSKINEDKARNFVFNCPNCVVTSYCPIGLGFSNMLEKELLYYITYCMLWLIIQDCPLLNGHNSVVCIWVFFLPTYIYWLTVKTKIYLKLLMICLDFGMI